MKWIFRTIGVILMVGVLLLMAGFLMGMDLMNLQSYLTDDTSFGEQIEYVNLSEIETIQFNFDTRDIVIRHHDDEMIKVLYYTHDKETWTISETNGVLVMTQEEKVRQWFFFRFPSKTYRSVELYLPEGANVSMTLMTHTGTIKTEFENTQSYRMVQFESSTGSIVAQKFEAQKFSAKTQTGSVKLTEIVSIERINAISSTGSVILKSVHANGITMKTSTGSAEIEDSVSTQSVLITVSTGDIKVKSTEATSFDLTSSTGNVTFTVMTHITYRYDLSVSTGSISVLGDQQGKSHITHTGDISITAQTSTGSIRINQP